jgi:hypothetical protein
VCATERERERERERESPRARERERETVYNKKMINNINITITINININMAWPVPIFEGVAGPSCGFVCPGCGSADVFCGLACACVACVARALVACACVPKDTMNGRLKVMFRRIRFAAMDACDHARVDACDNAAPAFLSFLCRAPLYTYLSLSLSRSLSLSVYIDVYTYVSKYLYTLAAKNSAMLANPTGPVHELSVQWYGPKGLGFKV